MRNIVRGSIARLVLIQLQFVKKELLVAMQAIDELFNANQVNLQLLAVTPAILAVFGLQVMGRLVTTAVKATTKGGGTMMESAAAVYRDVKLHLREIERVLVNSEAYRTVVVRVGGLSTATTAATAAAAGLSTTLPPELSAKEWGEILSILHRIHLLLMIHSGGTFESHTLQQLQEDLRDMVRPGLSVQQRLSIVERIHRHYAFLHGSRRMFGGGFMQ
jgi:nuclear-control-of-ATPase protein 2